MKNLLSLFLFASLLFLSNCKEVDHNPPVKPELVSPENLMTDTERNLVFNWKASKEALNYTFQLSLSSEFAVIEYTAPDIDALSHMVNDLKWDTRYYWRVNAKNNEGTSPWSDVWEFTTKPVGIPQLIAPANALNILQQEQKLEWGSVMDATAYNLEVSLDSDFSSTVFSETNLTNLNFTVTDLDWNEKYYWRVNASLNSTNSDWSEVWSFTTNLPIPVDNLVAYYPFNGNSNDETGNGNNGIVNGAVLTTDRFDSPNDAFYFDGNDDISVASNETLNLVGEMAISVWFYSEGPPEFRTNHTLISKLDRDAPGGTTAPYDFTINYQAGIPTDYKKPMFVSAKGGAYQYLQSPNDIINNAWNHAVVIVSGTNIKIFINTTLYLDTTIDNSKRVGNTAKLLIGSGNRTDPPAEFMVGKIDDIRIYKRALSNLEILALYFE